MLVGILLVLSGLILLLGSYGGRGRGGRSQRPLDIVAAVLGIFDIVVGILNLSSLLYAVILIIAGLALAANVLGAFPGIGPSLNRAGNYLRGAALVIGILALIAGIVVLL